MSKHFFFLKRNSSPNRILFLGDLMDGGREWTDRVWDVEWNRFQTIFKADYLKRNNATKFHFVAGNHDIGVDKQIVSWAAQRYRHRISDLNYVFEEKGHIIVVLDTISYENPNPTINGESKRFLQFVLESMSLFLFFAFRQS
ncbi:Cell division control protein 1 [Smittium mucronatum]|uniref:Cell division control protein 1 n=1 Tax=Smittium mucronatum TaxID=133383 RepID=A0A1R0GZ38_9FUNG|nr:Cell division control protein 1 [Smittium mucronatum]